MALPMTLVPGKGFPVAAFGAGVLALMGQS